MKKIETDCNIVSTVFFFIIIISFVSLTVFPSSFLFFVTFDITTGTYSFDMKQ